jgi:hypothetical protein
VALIHNWSGAARMNRTGPIWWSTPPAGVSIKDPSLSGRDDNEILGWSYG